MLLTTPLLGLLAIWGPALAPPQERETVRESHPDGSRRLEAEAVRAPDGSLVLDGKYALYRPDGSRECAGRYRAGVRHGAWRFLHAGGEQKRLEGSYRDGWRDGAWRGWTPDGVVDPTETGTYRRLSSLHPGGEALAQGETLDHVPHGRWELAWPSGLPMARGELRRGRMHGTWLFWHAEGSLDPGWLTGVYEDGRRAGDAPAGELPQSPEPDLGRLPPLAPEGELPVGVLEDAQRAVERLRERLGSADALGEEGQADLLLLARLGRAADGLRLAPLRELDLADAADAAFAVRWERDVLGEPTRGAGFGMGAGTDPESQARNRRCILRWHSLLALARLEPYSLEFELAYPYPRPGGAPPAGARHAPASDDLCARTPVLPIPGLDGDAARAAMHPRVASRLASGRAPPQVWGKRGAAALDAALAWLVAHQAPDGRWSGARFMELNGLGRTCACDGPGQGFHDVGLTGLALLALMGDGSSPRHGRHAGAVRRGLGFLLSAQDPESGLVGGTHGPGFVYDHAIAAQVLCEAAALCDHQGLRLAARAALDVCLRARNPYSAWRYELVPDGNNDTSITGWMVLALLSGRELGLDVDPAAFQGALAWMDNVTEPSTGRCGYDVIGSLSARVPAVNDRYPPEKGEAMTAVALLCRQWLGPGEASDPILDKYAMLLRARLPSWSEHGDADMYYWYYGTQAMQRRGGTDWAMWHKALELAVIDTQRRDGDCAGSWDPICPWGFAGGRVYATALLALCLEAPFRYAAPSADG